MGPKIHPLSIKLPEECESVSTNRSILSNSQATSLYLSSLTSSPDSANLINSQDDFRFTNGQLVHAHNNLNEFYFIVNQELIMENYQRLVNIGYRFELAEANHEINIITTWAFLSQALDGVITPLNFLINGNSTDSLSNKRKRKDDDEEDDYSFSDIYNAMRLKLSSDSYSNSRSSENNSKNSGQKSISSEQPSKNHINNYDVIFDNEVHSVVHQNDFMVNLLDYFI